jgi:transposase
LSDSSNRCAEDWWEGSYTRILFPNAKLRSQRISEFYRQLGDEAVHRAFFNNYLSLFCQNKRVGVLIDSTGMPNDIQFPLAATNTHNGVTSNETRLLLVVDRKSEMPLFFRYNSGNIVDVTTLRSTIVELEAFGVNTDYAIVDAGYYSECNIKSLYGDDNEGKAIPFLTRIGSNLKLYKQLVSEHAEDLTKSKYMLMQRDRLLSVKRIEVDLFNHSGYAYVAIDHMRREDEIYKYAKSTLDDKDVSHEEMDASIKTKGFFILISSEMIETKDVMPLYYTRQTVEQIFDVSKNYVDLLPLRVHNEETFRGHLMLSFIATVVFLSINQLLKDTAFNTEGAFVVLRNQKCKVFDDRILPKEPNKKMNDIYKKLKINPPICITIGGKN